MLLILIGGKKKLILRKFLWLWLMEVKFDDTFGVGWLRVLRF